MARRPLSFAVNAGPVMSALVGSAKIAEFRIGDGAWIIQAKATVRTLRPEKINVQMRLAVTEGAASIEDRALTSADNLGYATLVAILGVHVSTSALLEMEMTNPGPSHAELSHVGLRE